MRTARSSKRPAGFRAPILLVVLVALWAAPSGWADAGPVLDAPADGETVALPDTFALTLPAEGWVRVQISAGETFDGASLACDSGWYHSGFHTSSSWTLPGVIGYSDVACDLEPGAYRWRAAYGGPTGEVPSDDGAAWSDVASFSISDGVPAPTPPPPAPPAPPAPPPDEPEYDEQEESLCGAEGDEDPDGGDPGETEFSQDDVEPTAEELAIGTPPPAEPETFGSLATAGESDRAGETDGEEADSGFDATGATECSRREILRWVGVAEFHVALGFHGTFTYQDGRETKTQVALQVPGRGWTLGGWVTEARNRGAQWNWPRRGPFHRRIAAEYTFRKHVRCSKGGCYAWWAPHQWTGRLRPGAIRIQTTGWNNRYKFRLPHGHTWTKWLGTNKTMDKAAYVAGVTLSAQAGYSTITKMTWRSTPRCEENWIDPIDDHATSAQLIFTWSDRC